MAIWGCLDFQDGVSMIMEQLIFFHDHTMMVMIIVVILVGYVLMNSCCGIYYNLGLFDGQELESIWTLLPAVFLIFIALPSLRLLYLMEEGDFYEMTVKIMGHQWYWGYEYSDIELMNFDSYMKVDSDIVYRLLEVDNSLIIPYGMSVRMIITSMDVIHSWTIPALGMSIDAVPGRLNQLIMNFNRMGLFSGQCSEICGANHSFMPIMISVVSCSDFLGMWWMSGWYKR